MLLVIDVGNSNTVIGAMEDAKVRYRWRITTKSRTTDELGMLLLELFRFRSINPRYFGCMCFLCCSSVLYPIEKTSTIFQGCFCITKVSKQGCVFVGNTATWADHIIGTVAGYHSASNSGGCELERQPR